jgi:Secretion system C-terminal sorting domain
MKKLFLLLLAVAATTGMRAQQVNTILLNQPVDPLPAKHLVTNPHIAAGPGNRHKGAAKTTASLHSDWYNLWDEMVDSTSTTAPHSYLYYWDVAPDSNIFDLSGFFPPYHIYVHGMGMSFDPSDSAYYYHPFNVAYQPSAPFLYYVPYELDSFWVPGIYQRNDTTSTIVDSLIVEFLVSQIGATPDSGAYNLQTTSADTIYRPCTADRRPRFATPRYFRTADECIDPVLTKTVHQRYAFPLTSADAFTYNTTKFNLPVPITVNPGRYLTSYVYFKPQVTYPLGTVHSSANYYWLYAGEPNGLSTWFPQSARNTSIGYPGSHQGGLIATNQIRYSDLGFTWAGHNVLLPNYAYARPGANPPPGFSVPHMAFHINWSPDALSIKTTGNNLLSANAFPVPSSGIVYINYELQSPANAQVTLSNMLGQVVDARNTEQSNNGSVTFNVSLLPAGIYIYTVEADGQRTTGRIVVAH